MPETDIGGALVIALLVAVTAIALDRTVTHSVKLGRRLLGGVGAALLATAAFVTFAIVTVM